MYDIITFGSAAQDIHVKSKAFKILKNLPHSKAGEKDFGAPFGSGEGICLALGSKIDVEDISFATGGGGTNTAATFAKQGFKTAFCGAIGSDMAGLEIVRELKNFRIDTRFLVKKKEKHTNYSIVISNNSHDRTILVYRGASDILEDKDIRWRRIRKTKWFYLAPFTGLLLASPEPESEGGLGLAEALPQQGEGGCALFEKIIDFAKENNIKVAVNPSKQQLSLPDEQLKNIFKKVDILFLNQEEASFLTKIPFTEEKNIFQKIDELCPGIAVMTRGGEGVVVSDGKFIYSALPDPDRKVVDTTGAGDSFASGFLSDYIRYNGDIEKAIQLGLANSAGNLSEVGAKTGLLSKDSKFNRVSVVKQLCSENNLCIIK